MLARIRPAVVILGALTLLTGAVYPLLITVVAQTLFPSQANGSLLYRNHCAVGSNLIGQSFQSPGSFWGRPSATTRFPYNATASTGSNLGPSNPALVAMAEQRIAALRMAFPDGPLLEPSFPVDWLTASASGLDPHISPAAAYIQVPRIAHVRGLPELRVRDLVALHVDGRSLGFLGEPRVNVLRLNLALDKMAPPLGQTTSCAEPSP